MARKAIVDRDTVLKLLLEGKTSQSIANQFGVSRQAIDLHRKEFIRSGMLGTRNIAQGTQQYPVVKPTTQLSKPPVVQPTLHTPALPKLTNVSLDQMIDLLIQSFSAMKRLPEVEAELAKLKNNYDAVIAKVVQMEERDKKHLEQEIRWQSVIQSENNNSVRNPKLS